MYADTEAARVDFSCPFQRMAAMIAKTMEV
jgi:hypothetical protein